MLPTGDFRDDYVLVCPYNATPYPALMSALPPHSRVVPVGNYIIPGLVNVHTHLELSSFKGMIPKKTGLSGFVKALQSLRQNTPVDDKNAVIEAMNEMLQDGIVAVGDIDNHGKWIIEKESSSLLFHHFFERFGIVSSSAGVIFDNALHLAQSFQEQAQSRISITPHAPYSCSRDLIRFCYEAEFNCQKPLSIHLLESQEEITFMKSLSGPLADMIRNFGINFSSADLGGNDSIQHILPQVSRDAPLIFVHNTFLNEPEQISLLKSLKKQVFLCLCLRANHYIEDTLPDIERFIQEGFNLCFGTDSLASNDSLRITDEMNFLKKNFPNIPDREIILWATVNGMRALNLNYHQVSPNLLWHHLKVQSGEFRISSIRR